MLSIVHQSLFFSAMFVFFFYYLEERLKWGGIWFSIRIIVLSIQYSKPKIGDVLSIQYSKPKLVMKSFRLITFLVSYMLLDNSRA